MTDVSRREKRNSFSTDQRMGLAEDDLDAIDARHIELRQSISKLTAAALGLLISVVVCTISVLLTVSVSK